MVESARRVAATARDWSRAAMAARSSRRALVDPCTEPGPASGGAAQVQPGRHPLPEAGAPTVRRSAVAVGVRGGVATLQPGLVGTQAAPVVAVREEALVEGEPAARRVGVHLGHP